MKKPQIIPCSDKLRNGKYMPHAILRFIDGLTITERPLFWDKKFDTKEEADKYAVLQAKIYIKNNLNMT